MSGIRYAAPKFHADACPPYSCCCSACNQQNQQKEEARYTENLQLEPRRTHGEKPRKTAPANAAGIGTPAIQIKDEKLSFLNSAHGTLTTHRKLLLLHLQVLHRCAHLLRRPNRSLCGLFPSLCYLIHRRLLAIYFCRSENRTKLFKYMGEESVLQTISILPNPLLNSSRFFHTNFNIIPKI